ncbi:hypothetical protein SAMN04488082_112101 [Desulfomicrobium apsheronum]|uniref:Uncharacterized protein n=1 Tax=Desulfomicrobium apsheronum TaxID=52560 RepID=A0A1I3WCN8_9BACT|nr:hypothetical protein [Desulfomicrobium apsheronum]SFK04176.1 hypothetical protein SAMN04488082_112101 [Desulfomicrobium apsheronum]
MSFATLAEYGRDHCVIDTHNLFVGTTLEDEILLLGADDGLFSDIARECSLFGLQLERGRRLSSYSGGEQSIICCLLLMHLLPKERLSILLVHVLETLSQRNRELLLDRFAALIPDASIFFLTEEGPKPVVNHA